MSIDDLRALIESGNRRLMISCDTEFEGAHTLTIQFAIRVKNVTYVQVYRSPDIPPPSTSRVWRRVPPDLRRLGGRWVVRPIKPITADLSPARVLADLLRLDGAEAVSRAAVTDAEREGGAKPVLVTLVAHFWTADFFRIFGSSCFRDWLFPEATAERSIALRHGKRLDYCEKGRGARPFEPPVLDYLRCGDTLHPLRIGTFDTALAFGQASLDSHAEHFLRCRKSSDLDPADKSRMLHTFRTRTDVAYGYAIRDAVLTLHVAERMQEENRRMHLELGFAENEVPALRSTQGARVADTMFGTILKTCVPGSARLSRKGSPLNDGRIGAVSSTKVRALMNKGSAEFFANEKLSKFGSQTGETHGGLLFSRSPTEFAHLADGQIRDVDFCFSYNKILSRMKMYLGRPIVYEPGNRGMTLAEAVAMVEQYAAGRDGWIIKVSGPIRSLPNVLIPSTDQAVTHANYSARRARQRAAAHRPRAEAPGDDGRRKADHGNSVLYTDVIESGIVAWATWLMIRLLPEPQRREYEALEVESVLFYHRDWVAANGSEFDRLSEELGVNGVPWSSELAADGGQVTTERIDGDFVALEYDIGSLAGKFSEFREAARAREGKGSGAELAWKQHANSMYGVLASPGMFTNNVVAANVVTATGRALAFAMQMSLNGFQVITDGCTYRRDRIPAGTFADCLDRSADYPMLRTDDPERLAFIDPATIPDDDEAFTGWYRGHIRRYFAAEGPEYEELFSIHRLEHKRGGPNDSAAFDGLLCDGCSNYAILARSAEGHSIVKFKARSFGKEAGAILGDWMLRTYLEDRYTTPPPDFETESLAGFPEALLLARQALRLPKRSGWSNTLWATPGRVVLPLGRAVPKVLSYKVIKLSSFLFRTPAQREKFRKAIDGLAEEYHCGPEILALRRGTETRQAESLRDTARQLYEYIRSGRQSPRKDLNLDRKLPKWDALCRNAARIKQLLKRRRQELLTSLDVAELEENQRLTGLILTTQDLSRL